MQDGFKGWVLFLLLGIMLMAGACSEARAVNGGDGGNHDSTARDLATHDAKTSDGRPLDAAAKEGPPSFDQGSCICKPGQVWLFSSCVPTYKLGCGATCKATDPKSCPLGWRCDPCAATTSCMGSSCRPACVPETAMGFPPSTLRISPTHGIAGKEVALTVEGGEFYVGAIFWLVQLGKEKPVQVNHGGKCLVVAKVTPPAPGIYPVLVGYGGKPTVLAGFYLASAGVIPPKTVQPGYPCTSQSTCAQTAPYSCKCVAGRCSCK